MMPIKYKITTVLILLALSLSAQIKNMATETVMIQGGCEECKSLIEKAGNQKKIAHVGWDEKVQMAVLSYDTQKTSSEEILKRIAIAGFDSEQFLAPDEAYARLPECCLYERTHKKEIAKMAMTNDEQPPKTAEKAHDMTGNQDHHEMVEKNNDLMKHSNHAADQMEEQPFKDVTKTIETKIRTNPVNQENSSHGKQSTTHTMETKKQQTDQLSVIYTTYFDLKDALVGSSGKMASSKAKELLEHLSSVKMENLPMDEHMVWMKVNQQLSGDAKQISSTSDLGKQREIFISLSQKIYELIKVSKIVSPVYYQFCPMANGGKGANWLSKENTIKNPYYGVQMLNCGSVVETIK